MNSVTSYIGAAVMISVALAACVIGIFHLVEWMLTPLLG